MTTFLFPSNPLIYLSLLSFKSVTSSFIKLLHAYIPKYKYNLCSLYNVAFICVFMAGLLVRDN